MKCKNCDHDVSNKDYFCPDCGKVLLKENFTNLFLVDEYEQKMASVIDGIHKVAMPQIKWNSQVDSCVQKMCKLKYLLEQPEFKGIAQKKLIKRIEMFMEQSAKPEFHIAFVGTIKAGKSTLINALLGANYASTSVTPETAVLTKFRHCEKENYVHIKFYSKDEWEALWDSISSNADVFKQEYETLSGDAEKDKWIGRQDAHHAVSDEELEEEIERWTSSKKVEHYFVKEVEIGLKSFHMPEQVVFVDTPGLDDAVKYRSNVTRNYIERANAVFACVKSDSLTGPELNTLYRIFSNTSYKPEKVYIIGTQWDSLNNPKKDWEKQKAEWVKYLAGKDAFGSKELAMRNITHAAAYVKNLVRDYGKLGEDDKYSLMSTAFKFRIRQDELEAKLSDLDEMSNIESIERYIQQDLITKYEAYLLSDIQEKNTDITTDIRTILAEFEKNQREIVETSTKDIAQIRQKYESAKKELEEVQGHSKQLLDTLKLVKDDTKKRMEALTKELKGMTV